MSYESWNFKTYSGFNEEISMKNDYIIQGYTNIYGCSLKFKELQILKILKIANFLYSIFKWNSTS